MRWLDTLVCLHSMSRYFTVSGTSHQVVQMVCSFVPISSLGIHEWVRWVQFSSLFKTPFFFWQDCFSFFIVCQFDCISFGFLYFLFLWPLSSGRWVYLFKGVFIDILYLNFISISSLFAADFYSCLICPFLSISLAPGHGEFFPQLFAYNIIICLYIVKNKARRDFNIKFILFTCHVVVSRFCWRTYY